MRKITVTEYEGIRVQYVDALQKDVVRFKLTVDLFSKASIAHPSLLPQLAELLESGTKKRTREAFTEALEDIGSEVSISHNDISLLTVNCTTLVSKLNTTLSLIIEMLTEPAFDTKEIKRIKRQLVQELHEELDDAKKRAYTRLSELVFKAGTAHVVPNINKRRRDITKTTRADIVAFHKQLLSRKWLLTISSDQKHFGMIVTELTKVHKSGELLDTNAKGTQSLSQEEFIPVPSKANVELAIGNYVPITLLDHEYPPLYFGLCVLGKVGGFSGRLMSTVREKEGLTYGIYARTKEFSATTHGVWYIDTFFTPKDLERGITSTLREVNTLVEKGITKDELARFKTLLNNQFLIVHEADSRKLNYYHGKLIDGLTPKNVQEHQQTLSAITKKEVDTVLRKYIDPNSLVLVGAGPVDKRLKINISVKK